MATRPSIIENVLSREDSEFLVLFFRCWDPATIFLLGRLNYRLRTAWSISGFLAPWTIPPTAMLEIMKSAPAIICGPSVMEFFDRSPITGPLDVCVNFEGLLPVGQFFIRHGYAFRPNGSSNVKVFELVEAACYPEGSHKMYGERSTTQEDHCSHDFNFVGEDLPCVVVHVVRCELHRYVFASHSTGLMNYISDSLAISVFPRSTFLKRKTFVSSQERLPGADDTVSTEMLRLKGYRSVHGMFRVIGAVDRVDSDAECGPRWIGDDQCWTIGTTWMVSAADPLNLAARCEGPAFDAVDWQHGVTRHGSYLRVVEPYLWRAWSSLRGL
ncbi:hypothetical protein B0H16DRAFT_1460658 [Mycena metata]|uniref:Uncharacterized protein n=1 Tax=Mycena metata TaxID=1033252 RepID=A0AAD7IU52_9AGAR|nr:hypothetical protein B0H16DRAFT_1460658 [Mycena metata]